MLVLSILLPEGNMYPLFAFLTASHYIVPFVYENFHLTILTSNLCNLEVSGTSLVTQAEVSLKTSGLATQLLKIKDHYACLVKLVETMKNAKYTNKEAVQAV